MKNYNWAQYYFELVKFLNFSPMFSELRFLIIFLYTKLINRSWSIVLLNLDFTKINLENYHSYVQLATDITTISFSTILNYYKILLIIEIKLESILYQSWLQFVFFFFWRLCQLIIYLNCIYNVCLINLYLWIIIVT